MDDYRCPWCGEDLAPLMPKQQPGGPYPFDVAMETHASDPCEPMADEMGIEL